MTTTSQTLPASLNFSLFGGDTFRRVFTVTDENSNPYDFTNYAVTFVLEKNDRAVLTKTEAGGISIVDNAITVEIGNTDTKTLEGVSYEYYLKLTNELTGDVRTWISGIFEIVNRTW